MPSYPRNNPVDVIPTSHTEEFQQHIKTTDTRKTPTPKIVWKNVVMFFILHCFAFYGVYSIFFAKLATIIFLYITFHLGAFGITGGAHRLWCHRSYKATLPLKLLLVLGQTVAHQNSVIEWSRDHRAHHKFEETDADPHNATRGFFFSHMGWLLSKKHEDVKIKGQTLDLSDLYAEPLLRFQHKYFMPLMILSCFTLPTVVPMLLWNEIFMTAYSINILRYVITLHSSWLVNSIAHMWGNKPYDKDLKASESPIVSFFATGEGWHNYHHAFPWDYRASEHSKFNLTYKLIDMFAKIGWAYDLKSVSEEMIKNKVLRSGDGSHEIWGWGDKDQSPEDYKNAIIYNKKD